MSVVFDCFWWWRREFGALSDSDGTQNNASKSVNVQDDHQTGLSPQSTVLVQDGANVAPMEYGLLPDSTFSFFDYPDWDWTTSLASLDNSQFTIPAMD
jgi:hypothetical protein